MLRQRLIGYPTEPTGELAFEELYRMYFIRLFRFCFSIVHQKEPAEEIVHDVFVNLWEKTTSPRSHVVTGSPAIVNSRLYLYIAVKNRALNYLRDNAHGAIEELSERCDQYINFNADPESLLLGAEALQRLRTAIDQLPPRCKLIFSLVKEDGLKQKDVARLLDLSVKTVEAQLSIALQKLAAALGR